MTGKILNSMKALAPEVVAAGSELHHLILGPGPDLEAEWRAAGLELPDVEFPPGHVVDLLADDRDLADLGERRQEEGEQQGVDG
jgi:hypothetical protein